MMFPVLLLLVTVNSAIAFISENLVPIKETQTENVRSEISDTKKQGDLQLASSNVQRQSPSGNLESEEPLLYGFFPAGFIWGAATSALQVSNQGMFTREYLSE